ncbi:hypothetical protein CXG81DRAFT_23098 [Caulochytrium protostelioides]|uniref:DUF4536 domain-containing protein n=1 Tax=Caulochytrium protostelioides TaxID=1555241 RepID=A0A4P9XFF1_9FUNG|nr:hypothetical protein CXG81DRAFT_23098 [Caulochytrium protostelioides]|eukprot:RKP04323.1 hypothetical protein CXG81DRAFT_23098 [Caulochytrium protostelioides]
MPPPPTMKGDPPADRRIEVPAEAVPLDHPLGPQNLTPAQMAQLPSRAQVQGQPVAFPSADADVNDAALHATDDCTPCRVLGVGAAYGITGYALVERYRIAQAAQAGSVLQRRQARTHGLALLGLASVFFTLGTYRLMN